MPFCLQTINYLDIGSFLSDTWLYLPDTKAWKQVPTSPDALARAYHASVCNIIQQPTNLRPTDQQTTNNS